MAKTNYGDGSIYYNQKLDRWVAKYTPRKGAKTKYLYGKSEKEVKQKLRDFKKSPEALLATTPQTVSVETYFTNWLTKYKKPSLKQSSYDRLDSVIRNHIVPAIGRMAISSVTSDDCQKLINDLVENGGSYSTVKKVYDTLSACFQHAFAVDAITKSPMLVVAAPSSSKFENKDTRALTAEEETRLLEEFRSTYSTGKTKYNYRAAFILMLNTGLREGEIVALDWDDVDFKTKTLHVRKNALFVKERDKDGNPTGSVIQIVQETPKSKASNRNIPLNNKAIEALKELREEYPDSPYVLTTNTGRRTVGSALTKQLKKAYDRAMIPNATVHTLRHTFATRLFEKGADVKDVSTLLGHSSVGITYNTYIHVIKKRKEDVVGLLD